VSSRLSASGRHDAASPNTETEEARGGKPHKFGVNLHLDLMKGIGAFSTRKEAEAAEEAVAGARERRGHRVFWCCNSTI